MKTLIVPIDNRPVTCVFPQMVAGLAGVPVLVPPRTLMGSLASPADAGQLIAWIDAALARESPDAMLICLDSLLYGGLVSSRRSADSLSQVIGRARCLERWHKHGPVFGQASIMRIADNYECGEEKPYWARYGREIFAWSAALHSLASGNKSASAIAAGLENKIPLEIRQDYLHTRQRNFQVCRHLITDEVMRGNLDFLTFSLDDCGQYGLNIMEKEKLSSDVRQLDLGSRVMIYPGADEVVLALLSRLISESSLIRPRAQIIFSPGEAASCPGRYEGQSIGETLAMQLLACSIDRHTGSASTADFLVLVHGNAACQGDHIRLPGSPDLSTLDTASQVAGTIEILAASDKPVILCDVAYANGSDPLLVDQLLKRPELCSRLWAYAGWNTSGNTIGSALATGVARWFAGRNATNSTQVLRMSKSLKTCLFIRLADDWAYQACVRKTISTACGGQVLEEKLAPYLDRIKHALDFNPDRLELSLPWDRTFEIEVAL